MFVSTAGHTQCKHGNRLYEPIKLDGQTDIYIQTNRKTGTRYTVLHTSTRIRITNYELRICVCRTRTVQVSVRWMVNRRTRLAALEQCAMTTNRRRGFDVERTPNKRRTNAVTLPRVRPNRPSIVLASGGMELNFSRMGFATLFYLEIVLLFFRIKPTLFQILTKFSYNSRKIVTNIFSAV